MILSVVVYYLRRLDHLFWRILCQIRIIKYCAEPSVREYPSTRVVFKGERIYECCFHVAGFYWKNFQLHPAAYNSPQIKLLQLRATLSDEDNVIAKRGTQVGCVFIPAW